MLPHPQDVVCLAAIDLCPLSVGFIFVSALICVSVTPINLSQL